MKKIFAYFLAAARAAFDALPASLREQVENAADRRCFVLPYIGRNADSIWLRLVCNYTGGDWVFFEKIIYAVDDERCTDTVAYGDVVRDNGGSETDKQAIREVLTAYEALKAEKQGSFWEKTWAVPAAPPIFLIAHFLRADSLLDRAFSHP